MRVRVRGGLFRVRSARAMVVVTIFLMVGFCSILAGRLFQSASVTRRRGWGGMVCAFTRESRVVKMRRRVLFMRVCGV